MPSQSAKPRLRVPLTMSDRLVEGVAAAGFLVGLFAAYRAYAFPGDLPAHFDAAGNPDAYGDGFPVLLIAFTGLANYIGMTVLNRFPHVFNYPVAIDEENAPRQYQLACRLIRNLKACISWLLAYILIQMRAVAEGSAIGLGPWFLPAVIVLTSLPVVTYLVAAHRNPPERNGA